MIDKTMRQNQGHTPFVLLALLLLFGLPVLFTLAKFVALVGLTERSHQLFADAGCAEVSWYFA